MTVTNPWDRPENSNIPGRPGDRSETPIYTALGKAISDWEGVQAATSSLFLSFLDEDDEKLEDKLEEFGAVLNVHKRAKILSDTADELQAKDHDEGEEAADISTEIKDVLAAYRGWAERRNDLAHGYVTEWQAPDYEQDEQPLVTVFSLLPSHARLGKWYHVEPEFNYIAAEIDAFAMEFQELDRKLEALATRVRKLSG